MFIIKYKTKSSCLYPNRYAINPQVSMQENCKVYEKPIAIIFAGNVM